MARASEATSRIVKHVDDVIDGALRRERIVGAVVQISVEGSLIYARAAGEADREQSRPMRENTIFRMASLTKPIVSAAALALVAENRVALDEPITTWLPSFRPRTKSGNRPDIRVRHLLTHTAGLDYGFGEFRDLFVDLGIGNGLDRPGLGFRDQLARLAKVPLKFDPGHGWGYSLATDVLGAVIAEAATANLPDVVQHHVTSPLKMADTTFRAKDTDALAVPYADAVPRPVPMSDPHELPIGGGRVRFSPSRVFNSDSFPSGGAGMVGTASDFMTFLEAVRLGGSPILDPMHADLMKTDQLPEAVDFPEPGWRFGMGAAVLCDPTVTRTPHDIGTWRWSGGYGHDWFINPRRALTVVSMTNTAFEGSDGAFPLNLRDAIYYALGSS